MWLLLFAASLAADWLTLQGSEYGREDVPIELFGFVQPQIDVFVGGERVQGERPVFNTVSGSPVAFRVFRARVALRGAVPQTNQRVSYFLMTEAGDVALTRGTPVVFSDVSVTLSAPGARLRLGQFKLPVMEEIQQGVAGSFEFIHFSRTLTGLMLENRVDSEGQYSGPAFGFRDVGAQLFEGVQEGNVAASYALMVSNGNGIHAGDIDAAKDVSARGEVAWVIDGERSSPWRREVKLGAWWLEGTRPGVDDRIRRVRRGVFLHVEQKSYWGLFEVAQGRGMLEAGQTSPIPGGQIVIADEGQGWGFVGQGGGRIELPHGTLGLKTRLDRYYRRTESQADLRIFTTTTMGVEYRPVPKVRIQLNYELRDLTAPNGTEPAQVVAASMADRASAQVTALF